MQKSKIHLDANSNIPSEDEISRSRLNRDETKRMLASDFGITSAFLRVGVLARVLGISQPTIYAAIRRGAFFLPIRKLGSMPVVKFDDLVDWYCQPSRTLQAGERQAEPKEDTQRVGLAPCEQGKGDSRQSIEDLACHSPEISAKEIRDDIVAGVLARMRGQSRR
ncbi:hypothetical protein BRCH_03458 [Candidatus Burkholderia brachyanthoides]|nr:hypothetical protein BRCH_03458 [Candidatus Burkholderia brachyanthoides]